MAPRLRAMALALGLALGAGSVKAVELPPAEEHFQAGRELLAQSRYSEACSRFEASQALDPASGTLLALAYCEELDGRLASAYAHYQSAIELSRNEGNEARRFAASERAQALSPRLSTVSLMVGPELRALAGFRLLLGGTEVEAARYDSPIPLDGGIHVVEAHAPGRSSWSGSVELGPEKDHRRIAVPRLHPVTPTTAAAAPSTAPAVTAAPTKPATDRRAPARPPVDNGASGLQHASWITAGASLVSIGIGTTFVLVAAAKNRASNANGHCNASGCDAYGAERRNQALRAADIATWSFIAGGALAASSAALYIGSARTRSTTWIETRIQADGPTVVLTEAF